MDIQLKIMEIANNLNITKKDKKDNWQRVYPDGMGYRIPLCGLNICVETNRSKH